MSSYTHLPYREGVGIMLFNAQGLVFIARRIDTTSEAWQMPQGGIDEGEKPLEAALRELKEETGTDKGHFVAETGWMNYDLPDELVPVIWKGRFRGQRQKWYLLAFHGTDADININTPHPEFCEWRWENPARLPEVIVPFKRTLYQQLVSELAPLIAHYKS